MRRHPEQVEFRRAAHAVQVTEVLFPLCSTLVPSTPPLSSGTFYSTPILWDLTVPALLALAHHPDLPCI